MIRVSSLTRLVLVLYTSVFLGFMLLPLLVTVGAAFNDSSFPTVIPWTGWTLKWFETAAQDDRLWHALYNSVVVAFGVVCLSVPIGTAAAILLNNLGGTSRAFFYALMTAPILTPTAAVGISTLVFWNGLNVPASLYVTTLGQVSIIAAFVMLLVLARLQSFDRSLEEAALDLGASHGQMLWHILLPHLRPALIVGAIISFLQSMEAYNVPIFTRGNSETLMTYIASKVRVGVTPTINAVASALIFAAILGGVVFELLRRHESRKRDRMSSVAEAAEKLDEVSQRHRVHSHATAGGEKIERLA